MSRQEEVEEPDWGKAFGVGAADSERALTAKPLITLDKDLETKTRIPQGFIMSMLDVIGGYWALVESEPPYYCPLEHCREQFMDPEAFLGHIWGERYRINQVSEGGSSRKEYVEVTSAPYSLSRYEDATKRLTEGSRK